MDNIQLLKAIEARIKKAEEYLPFLLSNIQQVQGIKITHRIKDKSRILEKIMYRKGRSKYEGMNELEILETINDIIGITVVIDNLDDFTTIGYRIQKSLQANNPSIKLSTFIDYISEKKSITGYKCLLVHFTDENDENQIPFEIQITDAKNLEIRESTHKEFETKKYESVRSKITTANASLLEQPNIK
ncbi:MAG: hypothetical protein E7310_01580 [Clostridiales bacterium]|nr:hypothetical protein [Clostridiales bacterium]